MSLTYWIQTNDGEHLKGLQARNDAEATAFYRAFCECGDKRPGSPTYPTLVRVIAHVPWAEVSMTVDEEPQNAAPGDSGAHLREAMNHLLRASDLDGTYRDQRPIVVQLTNAVYEIIAHLQERAGG